ncbi:hypothetical protein WJX82_006049 [Trebouxia sp. C0006]
MSRPRSKKELEEAGRRKLEAFRKQKATAKSLQSAPKADTELRESPRVASQPSPSAKPVSSDTSLARAASVLPVSTSAQPISTGGSEQDVDVTRLHLSAAFAGSSQAAKSDAPVQQAASPSASLVLLKGVSPQGANTLSKGTAEEAVPEAATSSGSQTASQLSLLDERQLIPGVSTGRTEEGFTNTEAFEAVVKEREASLDDAPAKPEAPTSSLKMLKEFARLAVEADTPDSPLVFPWSQGPNSTGAASAYASLSDSYLSRPPSQTPSRAPSQGPSPAKRAQHGGVPGSMPSLYTGLGSLASLAESLANGTVPAKGNNFTQLQQHIDDLTKEKFELVRGLKEQQKMAAGLSEENLLLTEDFNRQAEALQQTRKQLRELEMGVQEQQHSLDQLAGERDACKSGAHEAADRSKSLAAEVVALEEKVLHVRSREIRLEKETARLKEGVQQAEQQLQSSRQDRASLQATIDMLQEEKRSLLVKLRQAASHSDAAAAQAATAEMPRASSQLAEATTDRSQHQHQQQTGLALVPAGAADADAAAAESSGQSQADGDSASFRQSSNAGASTSTRLADKALAMYQAQQQQQQQQQQAATNSLQGGLSRSLAKLLPKGPGAAEQQQMVDSIHTMIGDLEVEKQSFLATMNSQQAELQTLTAVNSELQRKLEVKSNGSRRLITPVNSHIQHPPPPSSSPGSLYERLLVADHLVSWDGLDM